MTTVQTLDRFKVTTVADLVDYLEDSKLEAVDDDLIPPRDKLINGSILDGILEELPGRYHWEYTHDPYEDIQATITELPVPAWEDVAGVPYSELPDECPECGEANQFDLIENRKDGARYSSEHDTIEQDQTIQVRYSFLECQACETILIEDGEKQY